MGGFILEVLAGRSWRREGLTYWTLDSAKYDAERFIRRGKAAQVRILKVEVGNLVETVEGESAGGRNEKQPA